VKGRHVGPLITPNGATAYVVSRRPWARSVPVKVATGKSGKSIKVGKQPNAIAIHAQRGDRITS